MCLLLEMEIVLLLHFAMSTYNVIRGLNCAVKERLEVIRAQQNSTPSFLSYMHRRKDRQQTQKKPLMQFFLKHNSITVRFQTEQMLFYSYYFCLCRFFLFFCLLFLFAILAVFVIWCMCEQFEIEFHCYSYTYMCMCNDHSSD